MEHAGRPAPATFADADAHLASTLDNLDGAPNYADWIFSLIRPHLGARVLEVGAGHGTFTERLAPWSEHLVAGDLSPRCVDELTQRFQGDDRVTVYKGGIGDAAADGPYDTA